jgi:hypothetical protein
MVAFAHATSGAGEQLTRWWRRSPEVTIDQLAELSVRYVSAGLGQLFVRHRRGRLNLVRSEVSNNSPDARISRNGQARTPSPG